MKCLLLTHPKDSIKGGFILSSSGYQTIRCNTPQQESKPDYHELQQALSEIDPVDAPFIIIGDAHSVPIVYPAQLRYNLEQTLQNHPSTDLFKLSHIPECGLPCQTQCNGNLFLPPVNSPAAIERNCCAIALPIQNIGKIINILQNSAEPALAAIETARSQGALTAIYPRRPLFYQWNNTPEAYLPPHHQNAPLKKIAACITSYKRLGELQRQIYCIMHQTHSDLHAFVAAKGITGHAYRRHLLPHLQPFIDQGRLTIRHYPNKNQLSNFIDTIRGLDISAYDLFAKIDDDDFYSPDYFAHINAYHAGLPPGYSSFVQGANPAVSLKNGYMAYGTKQYYTFGSSMVMSRQALETLIKCELAPASIPTLVPACAWVSKIGDFGFGEDNLIRMIMQEHGVGNRAPYLEAMDIDYHIIVQRGNDSVTRGNYIDQDFERQNREISHDPDVFEHIVELQHKSWQDSFIIRGKRGHRLNGNEAADILAHSPHELIIKWDNWGQERFTSNGLGLYRHTGIEK